jgi:UDP-sulfoquinovose synthase
MKILILGGDGYIGWPTAMHFSNKNNKVLVVDNYFRRKICLDLDLEPLYPIPTLFERIETWEKVSGKKINATIGDCRDYVFLSNIFKKFRPEAVIHYAEQPSAPYSMINHHSATLTVLNNLHVTLNVIWAVSEFSPNCHIIKIGTMGEYGTPSIDIEEGWIDIEHKGKHDRFLFPRQASSLYHTTKIQDTDMLWFYVRNWDISATDLMQGPVYGLSTKETELDTRLSTSFYYDEIFGTVINRFIVQAVGAFPLTVYGKGNQTRGYINLRDTLACVELSVLNPPPRGKLQIFNQITETFTVNQIAEKVCRIGNKLGLKVEIKKIENPRKEKEEHYYNPTYTGLKKLGLRPHYLTDDILIEMLEKVIKHKNRIRESQILKGVRW